MQYIQQTMQSKEDAFDTMISVFESAYRVKLKENEVEAYYRRLINYPVNYMKRVIELMDELKFFPKISEIVERFDEYQRAEQGKRVKLPEPRDYHKEVGRKWMAQIRTILSYGGLLREDFDHTKLGKLYTPDELKKLLDSNLKEGEKSPIKERSKNDK